jgi:hypothetical protein
MACWVEEFGHPWQLTVVVVVAAPATASAFMYSSFAYTVEPRFTNAPVHEQFGSRTNFPSKKVSDDKQCLGLRTRKLATAVGDKLRVSARECQLPVNFGSVHIPV